MLAGVVATLGFTFKYLTVRVPFVKLPSCKLRPLKAGTEVPSGSSGVNLLPRLPASTWLGQHTSQCCYLASAQVINVINTRVAGIFECLVGRRKYCVRTRLRE